MIEYLQVKKWNASHKQKERQTSHDHISRCGEKAFNNVKEGFSGTTIKDTGTKLRGSVKARERGGFGRGGGVVGENANSCN